MSVQHPSRYDFDLHAVLGEKTKASAEAVMRVVGSFLDTASVLDVGCGDGRWLSICQANGTPEIFGVDGPWTDAKRLLIPGECFLPVELSKPFDLGRRFSLAVSLEVAEHLQRDCAGVFVDNLVRHSDVILFGAAIPYQGGFRHFNEQWQSVWAAQFGSRGFVTYDPVRHHLWNDKNVHFWYKQNILLYVNEANREANERVMDYIRKESVQQLPLDIVHPERYEAIATYQVITSFRHLATKMPRHCANRLQEFLLRRQRRHKLH